MYKSTYVSTSKPKSILSKLLRLVGALSITTFFSVNVIASEGKHSSAAPSPLNEGFIEVATGQNLHYISKGEQGKKPLLLFIHGAPERAEVWRDYIDFFSEDYFAVAYTSRGYYPSSIPEDVEAYTTTNLALDAISVAQAFGYEHFTVVGHDWGAATAWQAAIIAPDVIDQLIILSNPHPIIYSRAYYEVPEHREFIDNYIPLARDSIAPWTAQATLENNLAHFKQYVYPASTHNSIPWSLGLKLEETWLHDSGASLDAIYNHYKAMSWPLPLLNSCKPFPGLDLTVNQPVLILYGEQDRFVAKEAFELEGNDCHPNSIQIAFPDGDHFIHHEYKSEIKWKMWYFLNSNKK
ncbi:MAG: alpha/beta hydrolase [Agarilytica sp.]